MSLDADPPDPPSLAVGHDAGEYADTDPGSEDYRREELQTFLREGAWVTAFEQWAESTTLDENDWAVVTDLGLTAGFDFFWDDFADRVGYHAPGIPEDWKERELHPDLKSWNRVSTINAGLTELGQTVCDVLKEEYIDWESEFDAPEDLPDF
ncbi:hypothetical protein [Halosegnis sp.]|uniref:hypothetical protein n=1 Tax=Halosegnis sp. TaxID=2864959 RepID=UPI0035D474CD